MSGREIAIIGFDEECSTRAEGQFFLPLVADFRRKWQQVKYMLSFSGEFEEKIRTLSERNDNWDEKGSKKPNPLALDRTHIMLNGFLLSVVKSGRPWKTPFVSSDEDGHITIQWNIGARELHIEVGEEDTEYIKVWGVNIENEMHVGMLRQSDFLNLWDWLTS